MLENPVNIVFIGSTNYERIYKISKDRSVSKCS